MKTLKILLLSITISSMCGCGSRIQKAEIPPTANPTEEIVNLEQDFNVGFKNHYNILANDDFRKSYTWLKEAKSDLADGRKSSEILDDVRYGRAYLNRAKATTESRVGKIENILEARQAAILAGAQSFPDTQETLRVVDDGLRKVSDSLDKLMPNELAEIQAQYLDIELVAIKNDYLGKARTLVETSKSEGAKKVAPKTLNAAEVQIQNAESKIETNRNVPQSFRSAVQRATAQAQLLADVMDVSAQAGRAINEQTALRVIKQNREIGMLGRRITAQNRELAATTSELILQRALDSARAKFNDKEADVYQQDERLLLRLKSLGFASGSAVLTPQAFPTLNKVVVVAEDLGPADVLIEGHTDAVGSALVNSEISQKRAEAVASYLEQHGIKPEVMRVIGYGFQKPIASNKSATGRAQNRRVDIVITPISAGTIEQATKQ